jgi:hypothetical protein
MKKMLSYSGIRKFLTCRKSFDLRYNKRLEPNKTGDALSFGKVIHASLEAYYLQEGYQPSIDNNYPDKANDTWQAHYFALSSAMMAGYVNQYAGEDSGYRVLKTELPFEVAIINPKTGRSSRKYRLHGYIDMLVEEIATGDIWIVEHKTSAQLQKLLKTIWHDQQIMTYIIAFQRMTGLKVKGVIYNILQKTTMRQGKKETAQEFAKRLLQRYITDPSMYHREVVLSDSLRLKEVEQELWDAAQDIGKCDNYYKSRAQCYVFGECEFFPICNSGDNPLIIDQYYKEREDVNVTNEQEQEGNEPF